ncbi:copper resistance CopC/CopD family protein [uncultured Ilumatobacter sp.]|jgi:copper transport protein|uniref:copper resistance CopC/CopD family protein n=1 Tax=uncultured Ilumatobacter sp. TaxID=879968 RepID=UPI00374EE076|tara:strand:+ start:485 stop:1852 length:1368 start_codon:yes stop_codon:yes gene_type:complete
MAAAIGVLVVAAGLVLVPATASAHTGFQSSTPSEGAAMDEPVSLVTIVFTGEANPVGDQFVALTPDGVVQVAASFVTVDDKIFSITFDPPLAGGRVGIRWNVQAADAHPIEGAFSFTVAAPAPVAPVAPVTPTTSVASETVAVEASEVPPAAQTLEEFLTVDNSKPGQTTATVGRLVGFVGVTLGLGAFAFVATALRGRRGEVRRAASAVRVLGAVIVVGAAIEYVGVSRVGTESLASGWSTAPGFATVLRILGGIGLVVGIGGTITRGAVQRWTSNARSWPALASVVLIIASFWFDGHTVSKGFRPLHALVNSVHVAAGAVWVGGVVAIAVVVWSRYQSHEPMRVVELVVRFSKIATIALASVVVAGGVMAFLVLDSFGELTGTPWGKILLLKTAAVGLAMTGGAYNHFRLLPSLEADPESPELLTDLRNTVTAEAIMLVFVVAVTAWLVAAAS